MPQWKWYVYILECKGGKYYTGLTWSLPNRWEQHRSGLGSKYTSQNQPMNLVYAEEYEDFGAARAREYQLKDWSREKKRKLIAGIWKKEW